MWRAFWDNPHQYNSTKGERFIDVKERVLKVLKRIQKEHQLGNILIVTHSIVIKCLILIFKGLSMDKLWDPPYIHDTSLTIVELDKEKNRNVLEGDISHRVTMMRKKNSVNI